MDGDTDQSGVAQSPSDQPKATFDVTPQRSAPYAAPQGRPQNVRKTPSVGKTRIAIVILIVAMVAVLSVILISSPHKQSTTSTSTSISQTSFSNINSCSSLSRPGTYYLSSDIEYKGQSGACLNVTASDVSLVCNRHHITGSGPYGSVPPFTYGVYASGVKNVSVSGCIISNFSYGVELDTVSNATVSLNNLSINTMSNLFLNNVSGSSFSNDYLSRSSSEQGSIDIVGYSEGNRFTNNTVASDAFYGINMSSAGETFSNNYIYGSPYSFACSKSSGFLHSSNAYGNTCTNSTGCSFVTCNGVNIPPNISSISLASRISSCGSINSRGNYTLTSGISMSDLINVSNPLASQYPCIMVRSPNVNLNCANNTISNATIGILVQGSRNVTVSNCRISNSIGGIYINSSDLAHVYNSIIINTSTGMGISDSLGTFVRGLRSSGSYYGLYLSGSNSGTFQNFNLSGNQYGVYVSDSLANIFNHGIAYNNSRFDVYATPASSNSSDELMQLTSCGLTNANWATCAQHVSSSAKFYPVSSCGTINKAGNYSLQGNIISQSQECFSINASDVIFNCASHSITLTSSSGIGGGSAFRVNKLSNVTINNCAVSSFNNALTVTNSSTVNVDNMKVAGGKSAITFSNVKKGSIMASKVSGTSNSSIYLNNATDTIIAFNNVSGVPGNIGIAVENSQKNSIYNNTGLGNKVGLLFEGSSENNTVYNNSFVSSTSADYQCAPQDSNISSELNGINYGSTKIGCHWLAAVSPQSKSPACSIFSSPGLVQLSSDYVYPFGSVCYGVYANATTINCGGHTIISDSGGTFARFHNSQGSKLENCYLKGFSTPIEATNSSVRVMNNTITLNSTSSTAVNISASTNPYVEYNHIYSKGNGVAIYSSNQGYVTNNFVNASSVAYLIAGTTGVVFKNDTSSTSSGIGLQLLGSTLNDFSDNFFHGIVGGLLCTSVSQGATNNTDLGGNLCSSNVDCGWISSSKSTC